jgi:transcriptional regulator
MYTPAAFAETDLTALDALVARDPFVTLITTAPEGSIEVTHLPVLYQREGERILIEGHWARANPQATHGEQALLVVHGPHSYVSPSWYPDKEPAARVPTWNYAIAHLHGRLERHDDSASLASLVSRLSERFEPTVGSDWRFEAERRENAMQLRGIVGFRFEPVRVEMKFKLSQNHPAANVAGVVAAFERLGDSHRVEVAALMRERLNRRDRA